MNKIDKLFLKKKKDILSIFFMAGHPETESLKEVLPALERAGADLVEIGIPFSDPLADGPVIQAASHLALSNGMSLKILFHQLNEIKFSIPVVLMGYLNPVMQYGVENFLKSCQEAGVSGTILPDFSPEYYLRYEEKFKHYGIHNILLITPQTNESRIQYLANLSSGFLYAVSSSTTTGTSSFEDANTVYLERLLSMKLPLPILIGFGIASHKDFSKACQFSDGVIIGSRFISILTQQQSDERDLFTLISSFINEIKTGC